MPDLDLDKLRAVAEAAKDVSPDHRVTNRDEYNAAWAAFVEANSPAHILALLSRLKDAEAATDDMLLLRVVTDVREAAGVGHRPMLSELAGEIAALRTRAEAAEADAAAIDARHAVVELENTRLRALLAEAGEALEPFADDELHDGLDDGPDNQRTSWPRMRLGDYRAARDVATKIKEVMK